jgi:23S rRNA pseudouridine2457 synthase
LLSTIGAAQENPTMFRKPSTPQRRVQPVRKRAAPRLILLNKPFDVLCQFSDEQGRSTLKNFVQEPDFYPAGRLDRDSEGLVLLTNDGRLQARISDPAHKMAKTYWVQVEGLATASHAHQLSVGVELKDGTTRPALVELMETPQLWPRHPPVRFRQHIPTSWLSITLREGRNRQVRRMTAAVGLPTLRLIRVAVGPWSLAQMQPGAWQEISLLEQDGFI